MGDAFFLSVLPNFPPLSRYLVSEILEAGDCNEAIDDWGKLGRQLNLARHWPLIQRRFAKTRNTDRAKSCIKIADEAEKLVDLLDGSSGDLSSWKAHVLRLSLEARREAEREIPAMNVPYSGFDWLVGHYLAEIYCTLSGRSVGFSTDQEGQRGGPFVRFVEAVLECNNIRTGNDAPYSKETIAKAIGHVARAS